MVEKIWLEPPVSASQKALEILAKADLIAFSCGSWYGSVLANLFPKGIKEALAASTAKKILLTNLASTRSETNDFTLEDFIRGFQQATGLKKPLDCLLVPDISRPEFEKKFPQVAKRYSFEYSHFLGWDDGEILRTENSGVKVIKHHALAIDPVHQRIRHDPQKLAATLEQLV